MPSFETLLFLVLGLMTAAGTYALVVALPFWPDSSDFLCRACFECLASNRA